MVLCKNNNFHRNIYQFRENSELCAILIEFSTVLEGAIYL